MFRKLIIFILSSLSCYGAIQITGRSTFSGNISLTSTEVLLPLPDSYPQEIAVNDSNLHALPWFGFYQTNYITACYLWHTAEDPTWVTLQNAGSLFDTSVEITSTKIVLANRIDPFSGIRITEHSFDGSQTYSNVFGTGDNRTPYLRRLSSGVIVLLSYIHAGSSNSFNLFVRNTSGTWSSNQFTLDPVGIVSSQWDAIQGADGLYWVFNTHDSSQKMGLTRFSIADNGTVTLIDNTNAFLSISDDLGRPDGGMSIQGELPVFHVRRNNNKIAILCQNFPGESRCGELTNIFSHLCSRSFIATVDTNITKGFVTVLPQWSDHNVRPFLWFNSRDTNFYHLVQYITGTNQASCVLGYYYGHTTEGGNTDQSIVGSDFPYVSFCKDGWALALFQNYAVVRRIF